MGPVTGDAPQPGETPRNEGEPWSYTDPGAPWWRVTPDRESAEALAAVRPQHDRRRPAPAGPSFEDAEPGFAPEALDAHAAGVQDAVEALRPPAVRVEAEQEEQISEVETAAAAEAVAHHKTDAGYAESAAAEQTSSTTAGGDEKTTRPELLDLSDPAPGVPDIMVLPEPLRDRPTVALDRGPVPGQTDSGFARRTRTSSHATPGVLNPDRAAKIENSKFWLTDEERAAAGSAWPIPEARSRHTGSPGPADAVRGKPPARRPRTPRRPAVGLIALVALGLIAAFFSWVSAEPFWLAVGHGDPGTATVTQCTGSGVTQRCFGSFAAAEGRFAVPRVTLLGVATDARDAGAAAPARMVSADSRQAYVGAAGPLIHLRWSLGFLLVLLCGYGIAGLTGARRLETGRARRGAVLVSLAGPVLLLVGFLSAAY
jgi:hypothetical protein